MYAWAVWGTVGLVVSERAGVERALGEGQLTGCGQRWPGAALLSRCWGRDPSELGGCHSPAAGVGQGRMGRSGRRGTGCERLCRRRWTGDCRRVLDGGRWSSVTGRSVVKTPGEEAEGGEASEREAEQGGIWGKRNRSRSAAANLQDKVLALPIRLGLARDLPVTRRDAR